MVRGRLNRETNPIPNGGYPGFTPQHDSTGNEDFVNTSPLNPLPVKDTHVAGKIDELKSSTQKVEVVNQQEFPTLQNVKDADVKAQIEALKQQQQTDNTAILSKLAALETKLNGTINTQLTGSYVALSTAQKPQGKMGNTLFLWDTRQVFIHDGTDWREV